VKAPSIFERLVRDQRKEAPGEIDLIARRGSATDLAECRALHESLHLPYGEANWRVLLEVWRALLSEGKMRLCLVENRAKPVGSRVVSFNATLFITDEFCSEAKSKLFPYLGIQLACHYPLWASHVLNPNQVAWGNARCGLNVIACLGGWDYSGLSYEQKLAVREKQCEAFQLTHSGYRLKEFLAESIGMEMLQWMFDCGVRLRRDYSNYCRKRGVPIPNLWERPSLLGLTREEALAHPGSHLSGLFIYSLPRFKFSRSEQVLLRQAMMGETQNELAESLFISPWTVKKRWHAIYDRVAAVDTELLPSPIAYGLHATSRGAERRRHLLNYLRQHLEELRPFDWSHETNRHSLTTNRSG